MCFADTPYLGGTMKKTISTGIAATLLLILSSPGIANAASSSNGLSPEQIVATIESTTGSKFSDSPPTELSQVTTSTNASGVKVSVSETLQGQQNSTASVEILDSKSTTSTLSDSVTTFTADSDGIAGAVAQTNDGFSIYTVISNRNAPDSYSYKLNLPVGVATTEFQGGYSLDDFKDFSVVISAPWAIDANGKNLDTWYTLENDVLTQHIDLSAANIAFPVVADPNWSYSLRYFFDNISTSEAWRKVHNCFNCYFPVLGAPFAFPGLNDTLPLFINIYVPFPLNYLGGYYNMECLMGFTEAHNGLYGWYFWATKNHIDGVGSWIRFRFMNTSNGPALVVDAQIKNDFYLNALGITNNAYALAAQTNWNQFGWRLDWLP